MCAADDRIKFFNGIGQFGIARVCTVRDSREWWGMPAPIIPERGSPRKGPAAEQHPLIATQTGGCCGCAITRDCITSCVSVRREPQRCKHPRSAAVSDGRSLACGRRTGPLSSRGPRGVP